MNDHPPALPDEDVLALPDEWRRSLHPRRGGTPGPEITVDAKAPGAAAKLIARSDGVVEALLDAGRPTAEIDGAVRRHLGGTPDAVGAAVIAALAMEAHQDAKPPGWRTFVDAWTVEHGAGFAGCAVLEMCRTAVGIEHGGEWRGRYAVRAYRDDGSTDRPGPLALRRVRSLLAEAGDAEQERLDAHRTTGATRLAAAYLAPNRHDWVEEWLADIDSDPRRRRGDSLVFASVGTVEHLRTAVPRLFWGQATREALGALADGVGPDVLEYLLENLGGTFLESRDRDQILQAIALLPSDAAFGALLDRRADKYARRALADAQRRFPVRAMRLLAARGLDDLLRDHVRAHVETAVDALPALPADVRAVVEPLTEASARVPDAPAGEIPAVLVSPPWEAPVPKAVRDLAAPHGRMSWPDGGRDAWLAADPGDVRPPDDPAWGALAEAMRAGGLDRVRKCQLIRYGPDDVVRPLVAETFPRGDWARIAIARFEELTLDRLLRFADVDPRKYAHLLLPSLNCGAAEFMCDRLARNGDGHDAAREWFAHHGLDAVPYVAVRALGKAAKKRGQAEKALRHLAARYGVDAVAAARPDASDELHAMLSAHPVQTGLVERVRPGAWADPALLPQILMKDRDRALPAAATRNLVELLGLPDVSHHLDEVLAVLDADSVAGFGRELFRKWLEGGAPSKESFALEQLGRTGDGEAVRMLSPVIRAWPGEGGHRYAVAGLDVLAEIGTDLALAHLHSISQKVKFKGLKQRAQEKVQEVADGLGLTPDRLADRLVPRFGLAPDGSMTLDYGPRRFTVGFDEQLKPFVVDESGKLRKALPKPGAKDDPELGPAAYKAFATLKKDVRGVASDALVRLERALVTERLWSPAEFREHMVAHPLVGQLTRRLVWIAEDDAGTAAFRVAEDGTFADAEDEAFVLPESARVGIAHPIHLGESLQVWTGVFADYELLQPFEQLGRPVHVLTGEERGSGRLERFEGLKVPFGTVLGLEKRGWERAAPGEAGSQEYMFRRVADGRYVVIDLDPGFSVGDPGATGDVQTVEYVRLAAEPGRFRLRDEAPCPFGELSPVAASEILTDLTRLADAAG
ncbi:DUF4132 domain-containing protein [Actinomadura sp. WMMB 499]|uniref:DUF4132 domain-containing protein n=1 Tax=Actinomadura sp. WMMB 499 TaxID=1219491 RepID=UPI00124628E7|nr:DUF4132 domain-containing protein [Actinomadura sp. WMMB 499]QFG20426.1 DUF4132 domain-containing protein [Actinomadura sp. WMMB 499]